MDTIISLMDIPHEASQYQFLVEKLHVLAYKNDESMMVCILLGT